MSKVSHCNSICFLSYAHPRYMKYLFTKIQKQQYMLKSSLLFQKSTNSQVNNSRILRIKNMKFSGHCFYMNPMYSEIFKSAQCTFNDFEQRIHWSNVRETNDKFVIVEFEHVLEHWGRNQCITINFEALLKVLAFPVYFSK